MSTEPRKAWRCTLCGYIHQGPVPPNYCPLCGAPDTDFEPYEAPAAAEPQPDEVKQWRCIVCGYIHEGPEPPDFCPLCGASKDEFEAVKQPKAPQSPTEKSIHVAIIGAGIAGVSAAEAVRDASPKSSITLICGENALPYYRLNLTRYLAGEIDRATLPIHPKSWYEENRVELLSGERVDHITPREHFFTLANGRQIFYDKLILAMGSHPFIPPVEGTDMDGVFALRTVRDAEDIIARTAGKPRCVVIGGGILGLECAGALAQRGLQVAVLENHEWLMPRQLNRRAGEMLENHLRKLGIALEKNAQTRAVTGRGKAEAVELQDGRSVPAELVLLATGVRPDTYLARRAGLEVNRGIVVNNHLQTSDPDIYAAGDVAEHHGVLYGIWGPSQYQGRMAGMNAAGMDTLFGGLPRSNTLKVLGIHLASVGKVQPEDGSYTGVEGTSGDDYAYFLFRDGKMAGGILLGSTSCAAGLKNAVESERDFSELLKRPPSVRTVMAALA
ncbi:MAG TPA: FAD-dependent oxidoreductase [Kiritimatiellia bacterium]|nr:FAD-dependent oxidoreductase [Kiritimatiellia bacterium]HNR93933.1 FAD-dependent oxidoreductase [Kiritimatiellia bacterium]HNS80300.1 FAD-dependent oxidoreductase [Kiritimatiellia bacterium]HPA77751.1 FAD-dependent oxidoreductase [Kiritimatiellia bacterium]HQQ04515.1 FAD-dependent oxidoreductase [Kiritimatiellia bacterium]